MMERLRGLLSAVSCQLPASSCQLPASGPFQLSGMCGAVFAVGSDQQRYFSCCIKPDSIRRTSSTCPVSFPCNSTGRNRRSRARSKSYSSSLQEPKECHRNLRKSGSEPRPVPSAIFDGIDIAALNSWSRSGQPSGFCRYAEMAYVPKAN